MFLQCSHFTFVSKRFLKSTISSYFFFILFYLLVIIILSELNILPTWLSLHLKYFPSIFLPAPQHLSRFLLNQAIYLYQNVRKLADKTTKSTNEIKDMVSDIQSHIGDVSNQTSSIFQQIMMQKEQTEVVYKNFNEILTQHLSRFLLNQAIYLYQN